ncbi:MAG: flagellin, partial [bacterium]
MGVLQINQNIIALNATRSLSQTSRALERSVERLSTGLRINRAADDAAGLTISERLRAQVRGLARASQNASEGISLLQTAEGALGESNTILQRIRELAVQAANGVLTSNDRLEIQKEVDQLISEVDRIAQSTEFNTKRLLDGSSAALYSVDDPSTVNVNVIGDVGKGGNFQIRTTLLEAPQLATYKTGQFNTIATEDRVGSLNGLKTYLNNAVFDSGTGSTTGIEEIEIQSELTEQQLVVSFGSATISVLGISVGIGTDTLFDTLNAKDITDGVDTLHVTGLKTNGATVDASLLLSSGTTLASVAGFLSVAFSVGANGAFSINAAGKFAVSLAAGQSIAIANLEFRDIDQSGSRLDLGFAPLSVAAANGLLSKRIVASASVALTANGSRFIETVTGGDTFLGDFSTTGEIDVRYSADITVGTDAIHFNTAGQNELAQYGRVTQVSAVAGSYTFEIRAINERLYQVTNLDTGSISSTGDISAAGTAASLNLDSLQGLRISFDAILEYGETAIFHTSTNNVLVAQQDTQLRSISRFQAEGVFLGRDTVEIGLAVPGSGRKTTLFINATDTVAELVGKISLALADPGRTTDLNLEDTIAGGNWPNLVNYNLTGPAKGTISITSPVPGAELVFTGDEAAINALSLFTIQESKLATYQVSVINIESGQLVDEITTSDGIIRGVIRGVEIGFNTNQGYKLDPIAGPGANRTGNPVNLEAQGKPAISVTADFVGTTFLHLVPNALNFQIGANQGQQLTLAIAGVSSQCLGIKGLILANAKSAQEAITAVDVAIDKVSSLRSNLGSVQNRLESTIRNLDITRQNL